MCEESTRDERRHEARGKKEKVRSGWSNDVVGSSDCEGGPQSRILSN